jgi:hypothetical protein
MFVKFNISSKVTRIMPIKNINYDFPQIKIRLSVLKSMFKKDPTLETKDFADIKQLYYIERANYEKNQILCQRKAKAKRDKCVFDFTEIFENYNINARNFIKNFTQKVYTFMKENIINFITQNSNNEPCIKYSDELSSYISKLILEYDDSMPMEILDSLVKDIIIEINDDVFSTEINLNKPILGKILFVTSEHEHHDYHARFQNNISNLNDDKILEYLNKKHLNDETIGYFIENNKKYRSYVNLNKYTKKNCKLLCNKLNNYPFEKELKIFGNYYLDIIFDIKENYLPKYNLCIRTDIKYAFASVDLDLLFDFLIQDEYILNNLSAEDLDYIYRIYNTKYKYKTKIANKNPELLLGVPLSTILFQILMNLIIKHYKTIDSEVELIIFVDDILIFGNSYDYILKTYYTFKNILNKYKLSLNDDKTKILNINYESLIFLNRIIVSNRDSDEDNYIKKYLTEDNALKALQNLDIILFIDFNKYNFINIDLYKNLQNLILYG